MAMIQNPWTIVCAVVLLAACVSGQDCMWEVDFDYPLEPPLLLDPTNNYRPYLPVLEGSVRITRMPVGSPVVVACSGNTIVNLGLEAANATCAGGVNLDVTGTLWRLRDLACSSQPKEVIHRDLSTCGPGGLGSLHSIGFEAFGYSSYYDLISVCWDLGLEASVFTQHTVYGANVDARDTGSSRPSFRISTGFFTVDPSVVYTQASQEVLMVDLMGDADLAGSYLDTTTEYYFSRGHMSPLADFVTEIEQDASFYYINAAPQWQICNNGNWKYIENDVRDLASAHGTDLQVSQGGWQVVALDDINNNPVDIYLGLAENKTVIPAPYIVWKVVHETSTSRAAGLVSINNPHITVPPTPLCTNVCDQLTWLVSVTFDDLVHGYTYCCTVDELRAAIPNVPDIGIVTLLTD